MLVTNELLIDKSEYERVLTKLKEEKDAKEKLEEEIARIRLIILERVRKMDQFFNIL